MMTQIVGVYLMEIAYQEHSLIERTKLLKQTPELTTNTPCIDKPSLNTKIYYLSDPDYW